MKKTILLMCIMFLAVVVLCPVSGYAQENKWTDLVKESGDVLSEVQQMPDRGIPRDLLEKCHAIAIFPSTVSAAFVIGGKYGQGIIIARNSATGNWSAPAVFNLFGGSFGWQIGGQATDVVLLFMNSKSVEGLVKSKFKLGADAAAAAGPVGRDAEASTDAQLKGGILSYSRSRGLFLGINLNGAVLGFNEDANKEIYGKDLSVSQILFEGKAASPKCADGLMKFLQKYPFKGK